MKKMLITFLDIKGTDYFKFIPQSQRVNQTYYVEIVKLLCEALQSKGPELWLSKWIHHHDNDPAHKALSVKKFLSKNRLLKWIWLPIP